jgi:hypothetical protein
MSQYDLKNELAEKALVALEWHGDDTKVLIHGDAEKTAVEKGSVIEVTLRQARELLAYSHLWTLEGDKPLQHAYDANMARLAKVARKQASVTGTTAAPEKMDRKAIIKSLKKLRVTFNDKASVEELAGLLKEKLAEDVPEGTVTDDGKMAHYLTQEDIDGAMEVPEGAKVGDLVFIPQKAE